MTRFARTGQGYQKKQPHKASTWQEFQSQNNEQQSSSSSYNSHPDSRPNKRSSNHFQNDSYGFKKAKRGEFRRLKRMDTREAAKVCFNCRKEGHMVADCPEKNKGQGMGICFKCGSTEHGVNECRSKVKSDDFPYATCFICHEKGHLSKQCPDNPRGLYPNGGCCKECGSVEHFRRDCPELQKQHGVPEVKISKRTNMMSADAEIVEKIEISQPKIKKKGPKIVKF